MRFVYILLCVLALGGLSWLVINMPKKKKGSPVINNDQKSTPQEPLVEPESAGRWEIDGIIHMRTDETGEMQAEIEKSIPLVVVTSKPFLHWDVYFRWYWSDNKDKTNECYIWAINNPIISEINLGCNDEGLEVVLEKLKKLPEGSKVLGYPYFDRIQSSFSGEFPAFKWKKESIYNIVRERKLKLILSECDHLGNSIKRIR